MVSVPWPAGAWTPCQFSFLMVISSAFLSLLVSCHSLALHLFRQGSVFLGRDRPGCKYGGCVSYFSSRHSSWHFCLLQCVLLAHFLLLVITLSMDCTSPCCVALCSDFWGLSFFGAWDSGFRKCGLTLGMKSAGEAARHPTDLPWAPCIIY